VRIAARRIPRTREVVHGEVLQRLTGVQIT